MSLNRAGGSSEFLPRTAYAGSAQALSVDLSPLSAVGLGYRGPGIRDDGPPSAAPRSHLGRSTEGSLGLMPRSGLRQFAPLGLVSTKAGSLGGRAWRLSATDRRR